MNVVFSLYQSVPVCPARIDEVSMLFLLFLVPMALLSAFLTWRCWQVRQPRVAVAMAVTCVGCALCSALLIYGMLYLYQALKIPVAG